MLASGWVGLQVEQTPPYPVRSYHLVQREVGAKPRCSSKPHEFAWIFGLCNLYIFFGAFFPELAKHVPSTGVTCLSPFKRAGVPKAPCLLLPCESCLSGP